MYYRPLFGASRYSHYAHRMAAWLHGERLRRSIREAYGKVTPMMWNFTPYDGDWPFDDEIHELIAMEEKIGNIPAWAIDVAVQIDALPHCGQLNFPEPVFAIFRGIGKEQSDKGFMFCFEASSETKAHVKLYAEVLEGWLQGKTQNVALSEWPDAREFITKTYASLGSSTELKRLLVENLALYFRLHIVDLTTNDEGLLTIQTVKPIDEQLLNKKAEEQAQSLREVAEHEGFDVNRFFSEMDHPWLCHQRLFEQIDATLQRIGREESHYDQQKARQDAQKAANRMRSIYSICIDALTNWMKGEEPNSSLQDNPETAIILANTYDVLGERTPVKVWLTSAFRKKMTLFRGDDLEDALSV